MTYYYKSKPSLNNHIKSSILAFFAFFCAASLLTAQSLQLSNERAVIINLNKPVTDLSLQIESSKITYLGNVNIDELNLLGTAATNISNGIPNAAGKRHTYLYADFIIQTNNEANLKTAILAEMPGRELYYTVRAIEVLKIRYSRLYQNLVGSSIQPDLYNKDFNNQYFNKYPKIIISFNTGSPNDAAISGTWLNPKGIPFSVDSTNLQLYENFPFISINPDLINGSNTSLGSYPIYKKSSPEENYLLYLKEGLLHSLAHELIHRFIDINNNRWNTVSNFISYSKGRLKREDPEWDKNLYNFEEVMVNRTLDKYFRSKGGLSDTLLDFYDKTEKSILRSIPQENLNKYKLELEKKLGYNSDYSIELQ